MIELILVRGLPGSGKTTLAHRLSWALVAADDYFTTPTGGYIFDPSKLPNAHAECLGRARGAFGFLGLVGSNVPIVVHNTFSQRWEMQPYLDLAEEMGARVTVLDLFDAGMTDEELAARCEHGVPVESIAAMRGRWEHDWKNGNPLPPWER